MVQLMGSLGTAAFSEKSSGKKRVEDFSDGDYGRLTKRPQSSYNPSPSPVNQQWSSENFEFPIPPSEYNPLDEPSPLGLQLRKSASFLELIQMRLSQENTSSLAVTSSENLNSQSPKDAKGTTVSSANDKLKASNFPASLLRVGSWEYAASHEGDLVVKCYFAKHKLVWEVLEGGLKNKMEIQWSDIMALKATCPDSVPGTLTLVLARPPTFFKETNPQPRKHTLWQPTSDFTDGQASKDRKHFLQCPPGVLDRHYEKLIQCDMRLNILSRQLDIVMDSPFFESQDSVNNPEETQGLEFSQVGAAYGFQDVESAASAQSSPLNFVQNTIDVVAEHASKVAPSPSSVMDTRAIEGNGTIEGRDFQGRKGLEQLEVPALHPSMSMTDLVSHIGNCISEQVNSGSVPSDKASEYWDIVENIAQDLLSDNQSATSLDEKSLLKKVNSLCCLLQDPATSSSAQVDGGNYNEGADCGKDVRSSITAGLTHDKASNAILASQEKFASGSGHMLVAPSMPRIDSFGDFLLHLPRIASLPKFLCDIAENDDSKAK